MKETLTKSKLMYEGVDREILNQIELIQFFFSQQLKEKRGTLAYKNNSRSLKLYDQRLTDLVSIKYNRANLRVQKVYHTESTKLK